MTKNFAANLKIGAIMGSSVGKVFGGLKNKMKTQETELKRLRSAYKDAAKGTGEYAGKLDQLQREIDQTESKLKRLRAASKIDLGKSLRGVGSKFWGDTKRLGIAGGIIGGAGLAIGNNMLSIAADFEKAKSMLKTAEGSAEAAEKSFQWVQDFGKRTPYELGQVLEAFIKLKAYGIDPISGDTLRVLGDTASATGKDLMQAVEAIADATIGENMRLKEAFAIDGDIKGNKILYRYTDKMLKERTITVDKNNKAQIKSTLLAILNDRYKGAMKEQSKTWNGMVSNMKDAWGQFAFMVMESGPFQGLKNELGDLMKQVEVWANDGTMKRWAESTGKFMTKAGGEAKKFGIQIFDAADSVQKFLGGWDKLGIALIGLNFAPTIAALYSLGAAATAALGPWGLLAAAIVGVGTALYSNRDAISEALGSSWKDVPSPQNYELPKTKFRDVFGVTSSGTRNPLHGANSPAERANIDPFTGEILSGAIKANEDISALTKYFKKIAEDGGAKNVEIPNLPGMPITAEELNRMIQASPPPVQNNNININVTAPGADGRRIAEQLRSEFNRKPLYDMDSFAPAR